MLIMLMQGKDKIHCFKYKENTFSKYNVLKRVLKKEGTFCYCKKDNFGSTIQASMGFFRVYVLLRHCTFNSRGLK